MNNDLEIVPAAAAVPAPLGTANAAIDMLFAHDRVMTVARRFAESLVKTQLVPNVYRGTANTDNATAAILYGAELGLTPIQSLQNVFNVHGKPAVEARTMAALLKAKGYRFKTIESTDASVTVECTTPDGYSEPRTWTIERATQAGYVPTRDPETGEWVKNGNGKLTGNMKYITDPRAMLWAKCVAELARNLAPDVLLGIAYTREDLESEPDLDPPPVRVRSERVRAEDILGEDVPATTADATRAAGEKFAAEHDGTPYPHARRAQAAGDTPSEDVYAGANRVKAAADAAAERARQAQAETASNEGAKPDNVEVDGPPMATTGEQRKLSAQLDRHGYADRTAKLAYLTEKFGRPVGSAKELTSDEARSLTERLAALASPEQVAALRAALEADKLHDEQEQLNWVRANGAPDLGDWGELSAELAESATAYLRGEQAKDAAAQAGQLPIDGEAGER